MIDLGTFAFGTFIFLLLAFQQVYYSVVGFALILTYLCYLLIIYLRERKLKKEIKKNKYSAPNIAINIKEPTDNMLGLSPEFRHDSTKNDSNMLSSPLVSDNKAKSTDEVIRSIISVEGFGQDDDDDDEEIEADLASGSPKKRKSSYYTKDDHTTYVREESIMTLDKNSLLNRGDYSRILLKVKKRARTNWKDGNFFTRTLLVLTSPFEMIIYLTVPPVEDPLLHPNQIYIYPFTSIFVIGFTQKIWNKRMELFGIEIQGWWVLLMLSILLSIAVLTRRKSDFKARPRKLMLVVSIVAGILWLEFIVAIMVDILNFLQSLTGISEVLMGMAILGIGNSFVDLFIDMALSSQGFEVMAITGVIAGHLFNFLFGFGIAFASKILSPVTREAKFHIFDFDKFYKEKVEFMTFSVLSITFVLLIIVMGYLRFGGFKMDLRFAWVACFVYALVFAFMVCSEIFFKG